MNKVLFGLLLIAALFVSQTFAAQEVACKDHPIYQKAKDLILDSVKDNPKVQEQADSLLKSFEKAVPEILSAADLGVCEQFAGQKTCCDPKIIQLLDNAAYARTGSLNKRDSAIKKTVSTAFKYLKRKNCDKSKTISINDLYKNEKLTKLRDLLDAQKKCKIDFAKAIAQFSRGAFCAICAGVEKISTYVDAEGKLIISQESSDEYEKANQEAIQCIADNLSEQKIRDVIEQIIAEYVDDTCKDKKIDLLALILKIFKNHGVKPKKDDNQPKCPSNIIFQVNQDCESSLQGDSNLEANADAEVAQRLLRMDNFRVLATADAVVGANGVNAYISSSLDNNITEDGNITLNLDSQQQQQQNSALKLAFAALISLFALLL